MAYPNSRPYPDKWKLEQFPECLEGWQRSEQPPPGVLAAVQRWIDSRQDAPEGDATPVPDEGTNDDSVWMRAYLFERGVAITLDGRQVTCTYEVFPVDHRIVCERFSFTGEA